MPKQPTKPKKVSYEIIPRDSVSGFPMYDLMDQLIDAYHDDLRRARIVLAWCTSWTADVDGIVTLGKCQKASDLNRELAPFDFVILLRRSFWTDERVTDDQRKALLDHELCHAALKRDGQGEPVEDERGRQVYRIRRHDIEEFTDIVMRHGCYKHDLEKFAAALRVTSLKPFTPCEQCKDSPGWVPTLVNGAAAVARCSCYTAWATRHAEALAG